MPTPVSGPTPHLWISLLPAPGFEETARILPQLSRHLDQVGPSAPASQRPNWTRLSIGTWPSSSLSIVQFAVATSMPPVGVARRSATPNIDPPPIHMVSASIRKTDKTKTALPVAG
jgi:hypothetical protein